ncbi:serine--tRNA ligase [Striga asiatica]|uniref:serine--tRNA ligase n=1 Tax=Striga asiatica TaxID=4170 RepID=A0A5A7QFK7_STRAF|nr:serine--tRNA ligase [Striga asiatica]
MGLQSFTVKLSPFSILKPLCKTPKLQRTLFHPSCHSFHNHHYSGRLPFLRRALSSTAAATLHPTTTTAGSVTDITDETKAVKAPQWKAAIDFKWIRDNKDAVAANIRNRNSNANLDLVLQLYDKVLNLQKEVEKLRAERNAVANKMKGKLEPAERQKLIEEGKILKDKLVTLEEDLLKLTDKLQQEAQSVPNMTHPDAPVGGENCSAVRKQFGKPREFSFSIKDHVQLGKDLDLFDFDAAAEVSGSKFYYLKNEAVMLELALVNWAVSEVMKRGFVPLTTPEIVRSSVVEKCGFQPRGTNTQVYSIDSSDQCLIGTAEIPVGGIHMDSILDESSLPLKYVALSHCFRTEAGAAGAATRTMDMATEDLGAPAYRKFDVEAWMPGLGRYGEISSASNCTDYQSRRLGIRYRPEPSNSNVPKKGKGSSAPTRFIHTLNATACAVPRMIICLLENYQQEDGSVAIPDPLRPFMGGIEIIAPKYKFNLLLGVVPNTDAKQAACEQLELGFELEFGSRTPITRYPSSLMGYIRCLDGVQWRNSKPIAGVWNCSFTTSTIPSSSSCIATTILSSSSSDVTATEPPRHLRSPSLSHARPTHFYPKSNVHHRQRLGALFVRVAVVLVHAVVWRTDDLVADEEGL